MEHVDPRVQMMNFSFSQCMDQWILTMILNRDPENVYLLMIGLVTFRIENCIDLKKISMRYISVDGS